MCREGVVNTMSLSVSVYIMHICYMNKKCFGLSRVLQSNIKLLLWIILATGDGEQLQVRPIHYSTSNYRFCAIPILPIMRQPQPPWGATFMGKAPTGMSSHVDYFQK